MNDNKKILKCEFGVEGMHCAACELVIEKKLAKFDGVRKVDANLNSNKVVIEFDKGINPDEIRDELTGLISEDGYKLTGEFNTQSKQNLDNYLLGFFIALVFTIAFVLLQNSGIITTGNYGQLSLPYIFFIGVIASFSSCMAVVGSLVLSISANYVKERSVVPLTKFHISRIVSFFILGGLIGILGSAFTLSPISSLILNIVVFVFMLSVALNLLDLLPKRFFVPNIMPKFIGKGILNIKGDSGIAPLLLGAATFFLPCGFTQSMQLYALTTGDFVSGSVTMLAFALGTLPILALISFASVKFSKTLQSDLFYKASGFIIIFFGLISLLGSLAAAGVIPQIINI